jgi:succinate dehydrogenase/fumarate reductase flavoprotein subunit
MRKQYLPFPIMVSNAALGCTGDGQRMGVAIGAGLSNMDRAWGLPTILTTGEDPYTMRDNYDLLYTFTGNDWSAYRGKAGAIVVNRHGHRIGDESLPYSAFNWAFAGWDNKTQEFLNIPAFFICDSSYLASYTLPTQEKVGDPVPDYMVKGDTLEELAGKMGINSANLIAEVASFNTYAKQGTDPVFGRNEKSVGKYSSGFGGTYELGKTLEEYNQELNPIIGPLEQGPYYGAYYIPGTCGTSGGLTTNEHAQVTRIDGSPIAGLYAVGNCSMGVSAGTYVHGGVTVGQGSAMSWVAIRHALGISS